MARVQESIPDSVLEKALSRTVQSISLPYRAEIHFQPRALKEYGPFPGVELQVLGSHLPAGEFELFRAGHSTPASRKPPAAGKSS